MDNNTTYEPIIEDENLDAPATRADLKNLATKAELAVLRQEMNERFDSLPTKADFSQLLASVDTLAGQVQTYNAERAAEGARLSRIENWIREASKTVNIPFEL